MQITIIHSDGWQGLYINDILEYEAHSIENEILLKAIKDKQEKFGVINIFDYSTKWLNYDGQEWLENEGSLPKNISDIPYEYFS
jgi:hypothetical protein